MNVYRKRPCFAKHRNSLHNLCLNCMTLKRILLLILLLIIVVEVSGLISVAGTSAEILGYQGAFAVRRAPVSKTPATIAHMDADVYKTVRSRSPMLLVHGVNDTGRRSAEVK